MTTLVWSELRILVVKQFGGQTPRAEDEQVILDVFATQPELVLTAIARVTEAYATGKVTYPWSVLAKRVDADSRPLADTTAQTGAGRGKRIQVAEAWLRHAGCHFENEADVEDELFGAHGILRDHAGDEVLRKRLLERWRTVERPRGIEAQRLAAEHAANINASWERIEGRLRRPWQQPRGWKPTRGQPER